MLEEQFGIPVFINNDGDLFVYGEAIAGFLPYVNGLLEKAGSPKRYKNLFGVTLGTGFGGGIVRDGELFIGDNSMAGEVWLLRNKLDPADERRRGGQHPRRPPRRSPRRPGMPFEQAPEPKVIFDIGTGKRRATGRPPSRRSAGWARSSATPWRRRLTLMDGLAVIGGGVSGSCAAVPAGAGRRTEQHLHGPRRPPVPPACGHGPSISRTPASGRSS